jgi:hypothetical protein
MASFLNLLSRFFAEEKSGGAGCDLSTTCLAIEGNAESADPRDKSRLSGATEHRLEAVPLSRKPARGFSLLTWLSDYSEAAQTSRRCGLELLSSSP